MGVGGALLQLVSPSLLKVMLAVLEVTMVIGAGLCILFVMAFRFQLGSLLTRSPDFQFQVAMMRFSSQCIRGLCALPAAEIA